MYQQCFRIFALAMIAVAAVVAAPTSAVAADDVPALTLENLFADGLFDSSLPRDIRWLPDGKSFVYRHRIDGVDGLWRSAVKGGPLELITDWSEVREFVSGTREEVVEPPIGEVNRHPGVGDSTSISPDGRLWMGLARGDIILVELATGMTRFLTDDRPPERFPTFSPDGTRVGFVRDGDLYWVEVATGREHRLTDRGGNVELLNGVADWVYEEELDVRRSFWWSPEGDRIAYVQYDTSPIPTFPISDEMELVAVVEEQKYPKAGGSNSEVRLGVVGVGTGITTWVPTGVGGGYLARAGWLPDGSALWFEVLDRDQTRLELRVAEPGAGRSRAIVVEQDEAWVNLGDDPVFVDAGRFIWTSERDGWRHLYLYDSNGRMIRRLTEGPWQVMRVYGLDAARTRLYFRANAEDHRERHIYSIGLDGGGLELLVSAPGTHSATLAPDGAHFIGTHSTITDPPRLDLYDGRGRKLRTIDDGAIPALDGLGLDPPELGTVETSDGETLYTFMYRPPGFDRGQRYPALVYVYGGPDAQLVVNAWGGSRHLFYQYLARQGLIVFCIDNRGTGGRGHAFEAVIHRRLGEWELRDQIAGVEFLKDLPYVDPDRIGVYGGSYGGYMALMCMNRASEHFKVGIAYAPVSDWRLYDSIYTERYMDTPQENPEGYRDSAPLTHAAGLEGKLLICHGTMDNNVHLQNTIQMTEAYIKAGKLFDLMLYPRVRHGIRVSDQRLHFHRLKVDFLRRHLIGVAPED